MRATVVLGLGIIVAGWALLAWLAHSISNLVMLAALVIAIAAILAHEKLNARPVHRPAGHASVTAPPVTDHPVSIVEGNAGAEPQGLFLVALCDAADCGWMEFAQPGDTTSQESELRTLAAKHTMAAVPEVERGSTRQ